MKQLHHSLPPAIARMRTHFVCPGSPLHDRRLPMDWTGLNCFRAKAQALVKAGLARSWEEACSLLARHAQAVARARKRRMESRERQARGRWWDN